MKYRNGNIWIMSLSFIMSGVFSTANCFASVLQCLNICLNIMLEKETDFELVFGHFFLKRKGGKCTQKKGGNKEEKKENKINVLICKETNAHTKSNACGSFETNLFFNLALSFKTPDIDLHRTNPCFFFHPLNKGTLFI